MKFLNARLFAVGSLALLAAACAGPYETRVGITPGPTVGYMSSEQACADYGFTAGSAFDRCVTRERMARSSGRVSRDYAEARVTADARDACSSYGLDPGTARYDRCVGREVDARGYREAAGAPSYPGPTYRTDQYGNRYDSDGFRVDASGRRMPRS